jgi:hypothetical protein
MARLKSKKALRTAGTRVMITAKKAWVSTAHKTGLNRTARLDSHRA